MFKQKINIIIADDSRQFIEGLKVVLNKCCKCLIIDVCYNGKELTESLQLPKADLIISDIEMPVMSGIEAARLISRLYQKLPMIAVTMYIEKVFLEDVIRAGFKGFVYKPEVSKHLKDVVKQVMNGNIVFPENSNKY